MADHDVEDPDLLTQIGISFSDSESEKLPVEPSDSGPSEHLAVPSLSLQGSLDPELLRAAPLEVALSHWGVHWTTLESSDRQFFHLSRPVSTIDTFLSHDWETSRFMKLITLLMVFNSKPAALASLLLSVLLGVVNFGMEEPLIPLSWSITSSYLAYVLVFCFWQRIKSVFVGAHMIFMDRLCIEQSNQLLKQRGIYGIGAVVQQSNHFLALWSKRYFRRLWCAYEVGCFLRGDASAKCLQIFPVKMSAILLLTATVWNVVILSFQMAGIFALNTPDLSNSFGYIYTCFGAAAVAATLALPIGNYIGLSFLDDLEELPLQVQNFRVQEAQCYCCTHHHQDPRTGHALMCDRKLVYEALESWYSKQGEDPLERFNKRVQQVIAPQVLGRLGARFPLQYVVSTVWATNFPPLTKLILTIGQAQKAPWADLASAVWTLRQCLKFLQPFLATACSLEISVRLWKLKNKMNFRNKLVLAILITPIQILLIGAMAGCMELALAVSANDSMLPLAAFALGLAVNISLMLF